MAVQIRFHQIHVFFNLNASRRCIKIYLLTISIAMSTELVIFWQASACAILFLLKKWGVTFNAVYGLIAGV